MQNSLTFLDSDIRKIVYKNIKPFGDDDEVVKRWAHKQMTEDFLASLSVQVSRDWPLLEVQGTMNEWLETLKERIAKITSSKKN